MGPLLGRTPTESRYFDLASKSFTAKFIVSLIYLDRRGNRFKNACHGCGGFDATSILSTVMIAGPAIDLYGFGISDSIFAAANEEPDHF
jgi:hypothetical protein